VTKTEIADLFITAAVIDSRLPIDAAPKRLKGAWIGNSPLTYGDQRKWFIREKTDTGPSQLLKGDDPIKDWWLEFWDGRSSDMSRTDFQTWERANELIRLVADEGNRRALWAWAMSKVGTLSAHRGKKRLAKRGMGTVKIHKRTDRGVSFAAWCRSEGIHELTGSRRKDRAIAVIEQQLVRGSSPNVETGDFGVLPVGPIFEHISDNIAAVASEHKGPTFERDADTVFAKDAVLFDWNEVRNQRRRMAYRAKRREATA
jgi:hypothetical protein